MSIPRSAMRRKYGAGSSDGIHAVQGGFNVIALHGTARRKRRARAAGDGSGAKRGAHPAIEGALKIVRGLVIGVSLVLPGVSGGTMALAMGVYNSLINAASGITKHFAKSVRVFAPYALGAIIGAGALSWLIEILLTHFPLQLRMLFTGLVLGALPMMLKNVKGARLRLSNIAVLAVMSGVVVAFALMTDPGVVRAYTPGLLSAALMVMLGFITAATMVVPGISGSMLLMLMGYYQTVVGGVNVFTRSLFTLSGAGLLEASLMLAPFAIGAVLGIYFVARAIRALLSRYPITSYMAIIGLLVASPFGILYGSAFSALDVWGALACAAACAAGLLVTYKLGGE